MTNNINNIITYYVIRHGGYCATTEVDLSSSQTLYHMQTDCPHISGFQQIAAANRHPVNPFVDRCVLKCYATDVAIVVFTAEVVYTAGRVYTRQH